MNKNKIFLIPMFLLIFIISVSAYNTNFTSFYQNSSINTRSLFTDGNNLIELESTNYRVFYFINGTSGVLKNSNQFSGAVNNYELAFYNNSYYVRYYGGSIGSAKLYRYNSTYGDATLMNDTGYTTNQGYNIFSLIINKYMYKRTNFGVDIYVYDITTGDRIAIINSFSPNFEGTDCEDLIGIDMLPYGIDYDNDRYYFTCQYNNGTEINQLVYIESDFYLTRKIYNNEAFDESVIFNLSDRATYLTTNAVSYPQFVIFKNTTYLINSSNRTEILSSEYVDIHEGLTYYNGNYYDENNVCFDNYFFNNTSGNMFCNDFNDGYCFDTDNISVCSGGCSYADFTNAYGVNYKKGFCENANCSNECGVFWQRRSNTLSSVERCEFGTDGCLEWKDYEICTDSQLSENGVCQEVNTSTSSISKLDFNVLPYTAIYIPKTNPPVLNINLWNISYNPLTKEVNALTNTGTGGTGTFPLYAQIPYPENNYYVSFDCDYNSTTKNLIFTKETTKNGYAVNEIGNTTENREEFIINGQNKGTEKITFIDDNSINLTETQINVYDVNDKIISSYYLIINKSNGEFIVYNGNKTNEVLYTDSFTTGLILGKIEFELFNDFSRKTENSMLTLYRYIDNNNQPKLMSEGVSMRPYNDSLATFAYKIRITNVSGSVYVSEITAEDITSSIRGTSKLMNTNIDYINDYEITSCVYSNDGTYNVRAYLSEILGGQYFSHEDLIIIKSDVNSAQQSGYANGSLDLTPMQKLIMGFVISFVVGIIVIITGVINNDEATKKALIWVGILLFIAGLILFSILGWIPFWIPIVSGIVASLIVGVFVIKKSGGA